MPKPSASMELARTSLGLMMVSATYHTTAMAPKSRVENPGDRYLGWMSAKRLGSALCTAIDSDERAAGRMVVWVDAEAEVKPHMRSSFLQGEPKTAVPKALRTSFWLLLLDRKPAPWKAWAAMDTTT